MPSSYLLERAELGPLSPSVHRVGKNDRPESAAIDLPLGVEHTWAEALDHPLPNLLLAKGLMPRPVTRNHPRAALGKRGRNRALAAADAANQTDHDF